jgi:hypothetical protein
MYHKQGRDSMGLRGYVLVKLHETPGPDGLWELTKSYEEIEGIDFACRVIGAYDYVLTVDTSESMESIIEKVSGLDPKAETLSLTVDETYGKHRELRDLGIFEDLANY